MNAECIKRYRLPTQSRRCQRGSGMTCQLMLSNSAYRSGKQLAWWQGRERVTRRGWPWRCEPPLTEMGRMTCLDGCWRGLQPAQPLDSQASPCFLRATPRAGGSSCSLCFASRHVVFAHFLTLYLLVKANFSTLYLPGQLG